MATKPNPTNTELEDLRRENAELRAALERRTPAAIAAPFKAHPQGYQERSLVVNRMVIYPGAPELLKISALLNGLSEQRAKLANGKPVHLANHAVEWLLEQLQLVG